MTLEEMRRQKELRNLTIEELAQLSGVSASTIAKVLAGITKNPRYETRVRLEAVLQPMDEEIDESGSIDEDGDWREAPDPAPDDCV